MYSCVSFKKNIDHKIEENTEIILKRALMKYNSSQKEIDEEEIIPGEVVRTH